jgi:hypothetical protein
MHLVEFSDPLWFVMENVDLWDVSEEDSNGSVIGKVMEEAGFETRTISGYITYHSVVSLFVWIIVSTYCYYYTLGTWGCFQLDNLLISSFIYMLYVHIQNIKETMNHVCIAQVWFSWDQINLDCHSAELVCLYWEWTNAEQPVSFRIHRKTFWTMRSVPISQSSRQLHHQWFLFGKTNKEQRNASWKKHTTSWYSSTDS